VAAWPCAVGLRTLRHFDPDLKGPRVLHLNVETLSRDSDFPRKKAEAAHRSKRIFANGKLQLPTSPMSMSPSANISPTARRERTPALLRLQILPDATVLVLTTSPLHSPSWLSIMSTLPACQVSRIHIHIHIHHPRSRLRSYLILPCGPACACVPSQTGRPIPRPIPIPIPK